MGSDPLKRKGTIMKNFLRIMNKALLILEAIILLFGTLLSFTGTSAAAQYSYSYSIFYLVAVLGILFVCVLRFLRKKRFAVLLGILLILIYLNVGGLVYGICLWHEDEMAFLKRYEGKEITIHIGDETYEWNGEVFFHSAEDFEYIHLDKKENYCEINGKKIEYIWCARMRLGEPDKVYCPMEGSEHCKYLVFVRVYGV